MLKLPLGVLLSFGPIRRRIAFEIVQSHYEDLNVVVPLPGHIQCPIISLEHWVSFDNIFASREYDRLLAHIPLPKSWIDLGSHAGHFTLLLASLWAQRQNAGTWRALLVDADSRSVRAFDKIIENNRFGLNQIAFLHGAICDETVAVQFAEKAYMTSEVVPITRVGPRIYSVAIIREGDILNRLKPPYDLIKLDIEGAEFDFFKGYKRLLTEAKNLICEWHSWHRGGGGKAQLIQLADEANFQLVEECHSERATERNGRSEKCGLVLLRNRKLP